MDFIMFDSRDEKFKKPYGAVAEGTRVHFRISLPRELKCSAAHLVLHNEHAGTDTTGDMFWCGMNGDEFEWWETDFCFEDAALYYYHFCLTTPEGEKYLCRNWGGKGIISQKVCAWQQTVYEKDFVTPDWLDGGIMYQIFPDSFCQSGRHHTDIPGDRRILNWGDEPYWQVDDDGVYRNNQFFGGDIDGITAKLDYIQSLGVTCIYLNPIFESQENHRYSTANYCAIDPMLGTTADFNHLCKEAEKRGIRIVLDGVFSHTGSDSVYFNKNGRYDSVGAYNSENSPYKSWYKFQKWPHMYDSWWGFDTLPELNETDPSVMEFINGGGGVVQRWLGEGASGWRLDVADELPGEFLDALRRSAKAQKPDALIIGEVWEDATTKIAYSERRRYLLGQQLDTVMNYCFKDAVVDYLNGMDAADAMEAMQTYIENYPPQVTRLLMNLLSTHDTERIITSLAGEPACGRGRDWQSCHSLSDEQRRLGVERCKLASVIQFTVPGVPSIYYGEETGMEGYRDPFNRACYPWGSEDIDLIEWYRELGRIRLSLDCFKGTSFEKLEARRRIMAYIRRGDTKDALIAVNAGDCDAVINLPQQFASAEALIGEHTGGDCLCIPAGKAVILAVDALKETETE